MAQIHTQWALKMKLSNNVRLKLKYLINILNVKNAGMRQIANNILDKVHFI